MFGHDFLLVFMLAQLFKPIRLIACMFEKNQATWADLHVCSACPANAMGPMHGFLEYYMSSQWAVFHVHILSQGQGQLHVKPNGLLSNSNVGTAFENSRCLLHLKNKNIY